MTVYEYKHENVFIPERGCEARIVIESKFNNLRAQDNEPELTHEDFYMLAKSMVTWSEEPDDWQYVFICDCEESFDSNQPFDKWKAFYFNDTKSDLVVSDISAFPESL